MLPLHHGAVRVLLANCPLDGGSAILSRQGFAVKHLRLLDFRRHGSNGQVVPALVHDDACGERNDYPLQLVLQHQYEIRNRRATLVLLRQGSLAGGFADGSWFVQSS